MMDIQKASVPARFDFLGNSLIPKGRYVAESYYDEALAALENANLGIDDRDLTIVAKEEELALLRRNNEKLRADLKALDDRHGIALLHKQIAEAQVRQLPAHAWAYDRHCLCRRCVDHAAESVRTPDSAAGSQGK